MDESDAFIEHFHSIQGTLLKERKKALYMLLENHKTLYDKEEELKKINENLQPKTYLEEVFKLEVLIYYKRASELFEILKNGNEISCSKIMKQHWFINNLLENLKPKEFVRDIFPQLSIVVRSKLLKQILKVQKDEEFINSLFEELLQIYGLKSALILLPGCSIDKIKNFLKERSPSLPKSILKLLYEKDSTFVTDYYEQYYAKGGKMSHLNAFTNHLSRKDPNLYVKLLHKYDLNEDKLGKRTTKKYVSENREEILKNPTKYHGSYYGLFHKDALSRTLGVSFRDFIKSVFPKQLSDLNRYSDVHKYLVRSPKKVRYQLYFELFQEIYHKSLYDYKDLMTEELLETIPNYEEREKWVDIFENELKYVQYKRSSLAIPELKEHLFNCDDISLRRNLFHYLINTCRISNDYDGLLEILKLVCTRFKNTDGTVINSFLDGFYFKVKLENLSDEHWNYIHEIIMIQNIRNLTVFSHMAFEYCRYLYKSGKSFEDIIPIFLKSCYFSFKGNDFVNEKFRDEKFGFEFLKYTVKHYSNAKDMQDNVSSTSEMVNTIRNWNKKYPNKVILASEQKDIVDVIKRGVNVDYLYYRADEFYAMKYLICRENCLDDFLDIYFDRVCLANESVITWILKYKPVILEKKIEKLVETNESRIMRCLKVYLKKYEHLGLVELITKQYLEKLSDYEDRDIDREKVVNLLTSIMPKENYLKLLEKYIPTVDKVDVLNCSIAESIHFQIQLALAKSVRYTNYHADVLPILLKYCRGDLFQAALISLYSCFNYVPENRLKSVFEFLLDKPITIRKHAIFLTAMAFCLTDNETLGIKILNSDPSNSIQKHLFTSSYKLFLKNPLEHFWNIAEKYMTQLTLQDSETLQRLTNVHVVPEKYRGKCAAKIWQAFESIESKEKKPMTKFYNEFMQSMSDDDLRFLSNELCTKIISSKLCQEKGEINEDCSQFAIKFMIYGSGVMEENVAFVIGILRKYKNDFWNSEIFDKAKSNIYAFCSAVFERTMNKRNLRVFLNKKFTHVFQEEWKKSFSIYETFEEYLMTDFMCLKYADSKDLKFFATEILKLFQEVRGVFGDFVFDIFNSFLASSLIPLLGKKNYELKLMKLLVILSEEDSSVPSCLLIVKLLPARQGNDDFRRNFENIVNKLQDKPDIVKLHLNLYFRTHSV